MFWECWEHWWHWFVGFSLVWLFAESNSSAQKSLWHRRLFCANSYQLTALFHCLLLHACNGYSFLPLLYFKQIRAVILFGLVVFKQTLLIWLFCFRFVCLSKNLWLWGWGISSLPLTNRTMLGDLKKVKSGTVADWKNIVAVKHKSWLLFVCQN